MSSAYSSSTLTFSLEVLSGRAFDPRKGAFGGGETERAVETPFAAITLARSRSVLDIGYSMSHPDYLGLLLAWKKTGGELVGADIISPTRVASRYPDDWRDKILATEVLLGDVRTLDLDGRTFDAVMCISTLEHIGFDLPSDSQETAFDRPTDKNALPGRDPAADRDAIAAFRRALRPDATLCLTVPAGEGGARATRDSTGRWANYQEYGRAEWAHLRDSPGFTYDDEIGMIATDAGWQACADFEEVFAATPDERGFPRGCILSTFRAL